VVKSANFWLPGLVFLVWKSFSLFVDYNL